MSLDLGVSTSGWLLSKEVSTESFVGVQEDSVDVVIEVSADIFSEELNLINQVTAASGLLGLSVVVFDGILGVSWFNSSNVEASSEGVGAIVTVVEEIMEGGVWKVSPFLVNLGKDNWGH